MNTKTIHQSYSIATTLLALLLLALAGCGRVQDARALNSNPDVKVTLAAAPASPVANQASTLSISLAGADNQAIDGAQVQVEGNMSHAGMVPVLATAAPAGSGVYKATMTWTMAGDWVLTVKATLPDGRTVTREFPARVSGKNP
jgi:hypothetical protein